MKSSLTAATSFDKQDETNLNLENGLNILNAHAIRDEGGRRFLEGRIEYAVDQPCSNSFAVTTDNAQVVLPYTPNLEIDVYATLSPIMSFTTTDQTECPIDELILFASISDYPSTSLSSGSLSETKLKLEPGSQGVNKYFMSVGSAANTFKSQMYTGSILVCGKETLDLDDDAEHVVSVEAGSRGNLVIEKAEYDAWFKFTAGDDSSVECKEGEYKIQKKQGEDDFVDLVDEPLIALDAEQILINKSLTTVKPYEVYFIKKTAGGVISRKKLLISKPCTYKLLKLMSTP